MSLFHLDHFLDLIGNLRRLFVFLFKETTPILSNLRHLKVENLDCKYQILLCLLQKVYKPLNHEAYFGVNISLNTPICLDFEL